MIRLLLVEDNPADCELVRRGFADPGTMAEPVEVTAVATVDEALALVREQSFSALLVDYSLPKRTGLEFLRALRDTGNTSPAIFLTGSADVMVAVTALQDGAADFVVKDVAFERALPVVIQRVLARHASAEADRLERERISEQVSRLERQLDAQTRELRRAIQESEALRRLGQTLATAPDPAAALDLVTKVTAQLLQSQASVLILRRGAEDVLVNAWGQVKQTPGVKRPDLLAVLNSDWTAVANAPLRDEGETIGTLWVGRGCHGAFAAHDTELLEAVADITALSIAKIRGREQIRRLRDNASSAATMPVATEPHDEVDRVAGWDAANAVDSESPHGETFDEASPTLPSILIVDDSEKVLMRARLALQSSMTVLTATSGRLAVEKYAATRPAIVLVDLEMPDMDGFATLAELQKLGCSTCVALAVRGNVTAQERARRAGYVAVIEKPFRDGELASQIAAMLKTEDTPASDHMSEDDGFPVLILPNPSAKLLPKLLPVFDRDLRNLAEDGNDRLILDGMGLAEITPEHVTMLVRVVSEAAALGIRTAVCVPAGDLVAKLQKIVEIRDARYVQSREAAKQSLQ